ncbi:hypothetical protein HXX76_012326 [Chlamydomonas incerta]|uniref:Signal recognition particle 19 kDa protein n=1 Tax=Chlamydomonas incerta TaxID=51695 RepID=A0A835VSJ6_CHLIN|nr:hypothetical protein HXX76_012326 [Chlamydomonas incerta]|eukprot:KAG2427677.1 hypothetical protein HXX76_012326 [Chlamydomonas incerta]
MGKSIADGRRIPKDLAVEEPSVFEMADCCKQLGLEAHPEGKHYPRDWLPKGRLRVALKGADGKPVNPAVPDRRTLLLKLAEMVPKCPGRVNGRPKALANKPAPDAGASSSAAAASSKPAPSKKGKKGKK